MHERDFLRRFVWFHLQSHGLSLHYPPLFSRALAAGVALDRYKEMERLSSTMSQIVMTSPIDAMFTFPSFTPVP